MYIKKIIVLLLLSLFVTVSFAAALIRLDQSQTGGIPPLAVMSKYAPYCNSSGVVVGFFLPSETYINTPSGVTAVFVLLDGASGVSTTHVFNQTLTYTDSTRATLLSQGCPVKQ